MRRFKYTSATHGRLLTAPTTARVREQEAVLVPECVRYARDARDDAYPTKWLPLCSLQRMMLFCALYAAECSASAHAACSRINGSSCFSIASSIGTSASAPIVPSTNTAFRCNPRSFARFIGEFLNAALNAPCDICNRSRARVRASLPASARRALNARLVSSCENCTYHGQQDCETCWYTRFELQLATGYQTLTLRAR